MKFGSELTRDHAAAEFPQTWSSVCLMGHSFWACHELLPLSCTSQILFINVQPSLSSCRNVCGGFLHRAVCLSMLMAAVEQMVTTCSRDRGVSQGDNVAQTVTRHPWWVDSGQQSNTLPASHSLSSPGARGENEGEQEDSYVDKCCNL